MQSNKFLFNGSEIFHKNIGFQYFKAIMIRFTATAFLISFGKMAIAQVPRNMPITTTERTTVFDGKARIEFKPGLCIGFDNNYTGVDAIQTNSTQPINISPGGGLRVQADVGYTMPSRFDFSTGIAYQFISGIPVVTGGSVQWTSFFLEPVLAYGIRLTERKKISIGVGLITTIGSKLKIEVDQTATQPKIEQVFGYGTDFGALSKVEFENRFARKNMSFKAGVRVHWVKSTLKTISQNGQNIPLSIMNPRQKEVYSEMPGNGIGAYGGVCFYF